MLENEEIIDLFKKSLSVTVKSIGKSKDLEINFVDENSSIDGKKINLTIPSISSLKKNINYIRGEADTMALEFRLHNSKMHKNYLSSSNIANKIFNVIEKSRIEAKGSIIFKGIKSNIFKKHNVDIDKNDQKKEESEVIVSAFKYVSYSELTNQILDGKYLSYKKLIKQKLGNKYKNFFDNLRKNINDQEKFANQIQTLLDDLGFF